MVAQPVLGAQGAAGEHRAHAGIWGGSFLLAGNALCLLPLSILGCCHTWADQTSGEVEVSCLWLGD